MIINSYNSPALLTGSTFFGTGGGGNPRLAKKIYCSLGNQPVKLKSLDQFQPNDLFITAYTVGGLIQTPISQSIFNQALDIYQKLLDQKISGIIPVEIGPLSLALAVKAATKLNLPLIDTDFVGGRSTPEVFLETISLFNIPRTPLIVINQKGNYKVLTRSKNYFEEESFLRNFANKSGDFALVLGYPIRKKLAVESLADKTVSQTIKVGRKIIQKKLVGKLLYKGKIAKIKNIKQKGFTAKLLEIKNEKNIGKLYLKNENLIFWINNQPVLTCPDLIILLDKNNQPLYNLDLKNNLEIKVVGIPAQPLWRTKKGLKLFNPRLFGYNIKQKLL